MRRITFRELVDVLSKDVEEYGDVLVKDFQIIGEYNELEEVIWDYECLEEDDVREINNTITPCDYGDCPYNAQGGYDCYNYCGLGADE